MGLYRSNMVREVGTANVVYFPSCLQSHLYLLNAEFVSRKSLRRALLSQGSIVLNP